MSYAIDFAGPFNISNCYDFVLVVVDRLSGYTWLIPTTTKVTAEQTFTLLRTNIFSHHGYPHSIVSDADPRFTSCFWRQTAKSLGIELIMATPGHHETNGQVERKLENLRQH